MAGEIVLFVELLLLEIVLFVIMLLFVELLLLEIVRRRLSFVMLLFVELFVWLFMLLFVELLSLASASVSSKKQCSDWVLSVRATGTLQFAADTQSTSILQPSSEVLV